MAIEMIGVEFIRYTALFFSIVGAFVTIYGGLFAVIRIFQREILKYPYKYNDIRLNFTNKIVFGLEFFIAADILTTLIAPTTEDLLLLAAVVAIRTILGYFLEKEAEQFKIERE